MSVHKFPKPARENPASVEQWTARRAQLADFDMAKPTKDVPEQPAPEFGALVRPLPLLEIVGQMSFGERARLEFHRGGKCWSFVLAALHPGFESEQDVSGFAAMLNAVAPKVRFCPEAPSPKPCASIVRIAPRATLIDGAGDEPLWLPPTGGAECDLTLALSIAFDLPIETIAFDVRPMTLNERQRAQLAAASYRLADKASQSQPNAAAQAFIAGWLAAGKGCNVVVEIASARELSDDELNALSLALFGCGRNVGAVQGFDLRLALPHGALPWWRFWPTAADLRRYSRLDAAIPEGDGALTLGVDAAGRPVRISSRDRRRHTFAAGTSGGGKSTFIGNACREDILNGEGVLLIDPHGDLAQAVRAAVPPHRQRDLIWIDLGSEELAWRLDLFKTPGIFPDAERTRIATQLISYFRQIWRGTPEAFGPAFENIFSGATQLLHSAKDEADRTLLKFRKVLVDSAFRQKLLEECDDEALVELWDEIQAVNGDWELCNLAPYITCKLSQLLNPLTRRFVGGDKPRLDLRQAMDERKIVIVNLNTGVVGEYGARFIGALILMAVSEAAMGRCRTLEAERIAFRVYIDEFQTMVSEVAASALAQCRKYNLCLMLANQNLGQLRGDWYQQTDVSETVLANCNTLIAFRLGMHDAKLLAPAFGLEDYREFTELGVGEMIVRRLVNGDPAPAQHVFGLPPIAPPPAESPPPDRQPRSRPLRRAPPPAD